MIESPRVKRRQAVMMGYGWHGMGWGGLGMIGSLIGVFLWLGVLAVLVAGIAWLVQRSGRRSGPVTARETPLNEARRRLAKGEITTGEYDEIVQRLNVQVRATQ
jgi:uncharacterized membrane protein